jgi:hypothetical protein
MRRALVAISILSFAWDARGDPLRIRGDAFVQSRSPVGLLVLHGEDRLKPWLDVETVAWVGSYRTSFDNAGDVQTLTVRIRDPRGLGEARIGRFVFTAGAIRPLHLDGARGLVRAPFGGAVEMFYGAPVAPRTGSRIYDTAVGGRASQSFGNVAVLGMAYAMMRKDARIADQELGPDLAISPTAHLDFAGRLAYDLVNKGPSDALASIAAHSRDVRGELFFTRRSPSRILPSTSLFSVLGDIPSTTLGGTLRFRAAPRLDLVATGGAINNGNDLGGYITARATLALDDDAAGTLGVEVRRQFVDTSRWLGARALLGLPLTQSFRLATEVELVRHDDARIWPWALVAFAYRMQAWDFAVGAEALRGRDERNELHALGRVTYTFAKGQP